MLNVAGERLVFQNLVFHARAGRGCSVEQLRQVVRPKLISRVKLLLMSKSTESKEEREARKKATKLAKAERRARREGRPLDPNDGRKKCDVCLGMKDMLIRCQIDASKDWKMVCGKCWHGVSGGIVDGNPETHPYYKYGGLWRNHQVK